MKIVTYLDQVANAAELADLTANFEQNCYVYGDEEVKGMENLLAEYDFEPLPTCMLKARFKGTYIYIFNCQAFYGDRLLVVVEPTLFDIRTMEKLSECSDCLGIEFVERNNLKQLRVITRYRAITGCLPYEVLKESK